MVEDGRIPLSDRPGLGMEFDDKAIAGWRAD